MVQTIIKITEFKPFVEAMALQKYPERAYLHPSQKQFKMQL
jgi:hypothetical protein